MRALSDRRAIETFMRSLGRRAREPLSVYLVGGATAVLHGWRDSTVDIDLRVVPDRDEAFRALAELKEELDLNLEVASPDDFVPVASDWQARSPFIARHGPVAFHHYDLHAQALSKLERGHAQDLADVDAMLERGLVSAASLWSYFERVRSRLYRYPAVDETALRARMEARIGPPGAG